MKQTDVKQSDLATERIGDIVAGNYHAAGIFKEFGIDFCCGGGITLEKACRTKGLEIKDVLEKLILVAQTNENPDQNYSAWEPGFLIDHIEKTHHRFVRTKTSEITGYAEKVARVHGERHPENVKIYELFLALSQEMLDHLESEEQRVFPLIREIYETRMRGESVSEEMNQSLRKELEQMESEHENAGDLMKEIRQLSNNFNPPEGACRTWQILYQNLAGFEEDLHKHVHLENNILFKKAEQLV
ncbi:iron-sulfur cluster repair di-iron protein [Rhodohalobacter sp. SW132]|uniref:iron-sulfur cluster repair di-iron protein n=1 Tax=Rhodohalobacter sp. SW132 TaxID=2293433 RepID=UPI000E2517DD|nr:iron-sulfur cluster repair di-iron protein [Rhodohalobacter sp. SW132]REL32825.1 iron-sulfur cluster repair di-iron protein [Rhodohalobacter sp. SW132]